MNKPIGIKRPVLPGLMRLTAPRRDFQFQTSNFSCILLQKGIRNKINLDKTHCIEKGDISFKLSLKLPAKL